MSEKEIELDRRREQAVLSNINRIKKDAGNREIMVWGIGKGASIFQKISGKFDLKIKGFIDRKANSINEKDGLPVVGKEEIDPDKDYVIVSLLTYDISITEYLISIGYDSKDYCVVFASAIYNRDDIIYRGCNVGRYTYGYTELLENYPMADSIGRYCSINGTARIWNNHPLDYVTTSPILDYPMFYSDDCYLQRKKLVEKYGKYHDNASFEESALRNNPCVRVGNDVWIGANVVILPGVHVGDGAVLAAGAIVTKDVEPYAIVGGVPAKVISYRFEQDVIEKMIQIRWWEWPHEIIEENIELMYQPKLFVDSFYNKGLYGLKK